MYHLVKSIYLHATSQPEYSILLLGLDAAGKTTLHNQIKAIYNNPTSSTAEPPAASSTFASQTPRTPATPGFFSRAEPSSVGRTVPTVGQNVSVVTLPDLYLRIWDVGGQHSLRGLWQSYYTSCHAIIFVLDSTDIGDADIDKLANAADARPAAGDSYFPEEHGRLAECKLVLESILQHSDTEGVPLLVLANKQDREDSVEVVRIKEGFVRRVFEGDKGGSIRDSRVLPCSALSGSGVKEAVEWVCSRVKWNREARPPAMR